MDRPSMSRPAGWLHTINILSAEGDSPTQTTAIEHIVDEGTSDSSYLTSSLAFCRWALFPSPTGFFTELSACTTIGNLGHIADTVADANILPGAVKPV